MTIAEWEVAELRLVVQWSGSEFTPPEVQRTGGPEYGSHFENVPRVGRWAAHGLCRNATSAFFPERGQKFRSAVALCNACPVMEPCRAYGLAHSALKGIFGGLTEDQRRRMRAADRKAGTQATDRRSRELYQMLVQVSRFPLRTWASLAVSRGQAPLERMAEDLRAGRSVTPPGCWHFEVRQLDGRAELWARLVERAVPQSESAARRDPRPARLELLIGGGAAAS